MTARFLLRLCLLFIVFGGPWRPAFAVSPGCSFSAGDTLPPRLPRHRAAVLEIVPPAAMVTYGFLSLGDNAIRRLDYHVQADMAEDHPAFFTTADNMIQYSPSAAMFALGLAGVAGRNTFADRTGSYVLSLAIMSTAVSFLKKDVGRERPDRSANTSFPSGHTALAFVGAEAMYEEYRDRSAWFGAAGYALATTTGILRVYNNVHWFSDIVAGAGFGILSAKLGYAVYPRLKHAVCRKQTANFSLVPARLGRTTGVRLSATFK